MKLLKKLLPYSLLLIISLTAFRFIFFISFVQSQKTNFREVVLHKNQNLVSEIKFLNTDAFVNKNGYEWHENNKELVVNGFYYEVISIIKLKNSVLVKVIADKNENDLFKNYYSLNNNTKQGYVNLVKMLLSFVYVCNNNTTQITPSFFNLSPKTQYNTQFLDFYYFLKQIKPPQFA